MLLGDPAYYGRFGFEPAARHGLRYEPAGAGTPHFQARPLAPHERAHTHARRGPETSGGAGAWRAAFNYCWEP